MGITTELCKDLANLQLNDRDREQLRILIIDFFAAAFAGYRLNRAFNARVESVVYLQEGSEESYTLFQSRKYPAKTAAFMNSVYGHGAELDDGNKNAAGHAGVHIIPAVFALADKLHSNDDDVLHALAIGYEAYIRISAAAQPGLVKHGFHSTGMAGTLACAAACAKLFHLDQQGIEDAIALATTMTGGLLSYGDSRPVIKPLNPGKAAENGVFASMLANAGIQGPTESLEGQNGWFHAVTDEIHKEFLLGSDHLLLHDCYFKLYPSCRHTHCGIDAAIALHESVTVNEIDSIRIYLYPNAIKLAGIQLPKDQDETKFSIPYTFARALMQGTYGIADMDVSGITEETLSLINKIELIPDDSLEDRKRGIRGTRVVLQKKDCELLEKTVLIPKGDPENPLSKNDIVKKLMVCSRGLSDENTLKDLVDAVESINNNATFRNPIGILGACV